jgi:hypothetical protein
VFLKTNRATWLIHKKDPAAWSYLCFSFKCNNRGSIDMTIAVVNVNWGISVQQPATYTFLLVPAHGACALLRGGQQLPVSSRLITRGPPPQLCSRNNEPHQMTESKWWPLTPLCNKNSDYFCYQTVTRWTEAVNGRGRQFQGRFMAARAGYNGKYGAVQFSHLRRALSQMRLSLLNWTLF